MASLWGSNQPENCDEVSHHTRTEGQVFFHRDIPFRNSGGTAPTSSREVRPGEKGDGEGDGTVHDRNLKNGCEASHRQSGQARPSTEHERYAGHVRNHDDDRKKPAGQQDERSTEDQFFGADEGVRRVKTSVSRLKPGFIGWAWCMMWPRR